MKTLTAQFVGGESFFSRLVELRAAGPYSHVDLVMPDGRLLGAQGVAVGGAEKRGVFIRPPEYEAWDAVARVEINTSDLRASFYYQFLEAQLGKDYDFTALLAFSADRNWRSDDKWFCSELAISAFERASIFLYPLSVPANKIDPCTAFAILSTYGKVTVLKG